MSCIRVCARPTQVVVVHHGVGAAQAGALLGEMVAELQQRGVFLQNAGDLHLHLVAQRLALEEIRTAMAGLRKIRFVKAESGIEETGVCVSVCVCACTGSPDCRSSAPVALCSTAETR